MLGLFPVHSSHVHAILDLLRFFFVLLLDFLRSGMARFTFYHLPILIKFLKMALCQNEN